MNFSSFRTQLNEVKGTPVSFDDAVPRQQVDAVKTIKEDTFTPEQVLPVIRKFTDKKITNSLLEQYVNAASSKEFTTDPITLELVKLHSKQIGTKYLFTLEDEAIGLSESAIQKIVESNPDTLSIETIKKIIEG